MHLSNNRLLQTVDYCIQTVRTTYLEQRTLRTDFSYRRTIHVCM